MSNLNYVDSARGRLFPRTRQEERPSTLLKRKALMTLAGDRALFGEKRLGLTWRGRSGAVNLAAKRNSAVIGPSGCRSGMIGGSPHRTR